MRAVTLQEKGIVMNTNTENEDWIHKLINQAKKETPEPTNPALNTTPEYIDMQVRNRYILLASDIETGRKWIKKHGLRTERFLFLSSILAFEALQFGSHIYAIPGWEHRPDVVDLRRTILAKECTVHNANALRK